MNREELRARAADILEQCLATFDQGQKEYAHKNVNAFENFDEQAPEFGVTPYQVLMIFAGKHWRGICAYIKGHKSQREDVRGRIKDIIVYMVLLWAMIDRDEAK